MTKTHHKHKTVGVSLSPLVRQSAKRRASLLGLSFSRYVSLCVEAEIAGLGTGSGIHSGQHKSERVQADAAKQGTGEANWEPAEQGTTAIDEQCATAIAVRAQVVGGGLQRPEQPDAIAEGVRAGLLEDGRLLEDVARQLTRAKLAFVPRPRMGAIRADFRVAAGPGGACAVALLCSYPCAGAGAMVLGQALMLQQAKGVDAVLLCVPYLNALEEDVRTVLERQGIGVATPDSLIAALERNGASLTADG